MNQTIKPEERDPQWNWRDLQVDLSTFPTEEPSAPEIGDGWVNATTNCLYIWDGADWICMPLD